MKRLKSSPAIGLTPRRRRAGSAARLATQSLELSLAAPQVVAHRLSRIASGGLAPSAQDRQELLRMGSEKVVAFQQAAAASWMQAWRSQMQIGQALWAAGLASMSGTRPNGLALWSTASNAASKAMVAGLAPVHAKAVANARRLARRKP